MLVFLVATILATWPLVLHISDGLPSLGDPKLNAWILHWDFHQTFRNPCQLFHANIFYPAKYTLAFSENLYGVACFGFPLYAAGCSTLTVHNVLFLLGMFLSALAAWALGRYLTGDGTASLLAGFVYAFVPWRLDNLPHIQFQWGAFLALVLLYLLRYLDQGQRRDAIFFGLCLFWNALCNVHYAFLSVVLVTLTLAYYASAGDARCHRRLLGIIVVCAMIYGTLLALSRPYWQASQLYGLHRTFKEIQGFSGRPIDFLTAGRQNKLYAPLTQRWAQSEGNFFPGVLPLVLALVSVVQLRQLRSGGLATLSPPAASELRWKLAHLLDCLVVFGIACWSIAIVQPQYCLALRSLSDRGHLQVCVTLLLLVRLWLAFPRRSRYRDLADYLRRNGWASHAHVLLLMFAAGALIALGTHTPYYRWLFEVCGGMLRALRVPSRGIVLCHLALGVLATWGLALLRQGRRPATRRLFMAGAIFLTAVEYRACPIPIYPVERTPAPVYLWLSRLSLPGAVVEWPLVRASDVEYMLRSTTHWHSLINGSSGFAPPHYDALQSLLKQRPISPQALVQIRALGACLLIFHTAQEAISSKDRRLDYLLETRRALRAGQLEPLAIFPHGGSYDYVFRIAGTPSFDARLPDKERRYAMAVIEDQLHALELAFRVALRPFGFIDLAGDPAVVSPNGVYQGWALDESGIAEVRVRTEHGQPIPVTRQVARPDVARAYPGYPNALHAGYRFTLPVLSPGSHTLIATFIAHDGGQTELQRALVVR